MSKPLVPNLPQGWTATEAGDFIVLQGPYCEDLQTRLRRIGGRWNANTRSWAVPAAKLTSLRRVATSSAKATADGPSPVEVEQARAAARRDADLVRWIGYVEQSAADGRVYDKGAAKCRELGIQDSPELLERLNAAIARAKSVRAEMEAGWAQERATEAAERAKRRANRVLRLLADMPRIGTVLRWRGEWMAVEGVGKAFRVDDDHPSIYGSHLLGHEGEPCAYAYLRPATDEEIAEHEAAEAAAKAKAEAEAARRTAEAAVINAVRSQDNLLPHGSEEPTGRVIIDTRTTNAYGGGHTLLVTDDAVIYIQGNCADGDDWSLSNVPRGIAWRSTDPEVIARALALGVQA